MTAAFWQDFAPNDVLSEPYHDRYRVRMGHRSFDLPIRVLPDGNHAVSSLLVNHAAFYVVDAISQQMAVIARDLSPDVIIGVPTLGLTLAPIVARSLGHKRYVPLSTSRKFWYQDDISVPLSSITSPGIQKSLYLDPNLLHLIQGKRVVLVDDVVSTGASIYAAITLLERLGIVPLGVICAMTQSNRWREKVRVPVLSCFSSPLFVKSDDGWIPDLSS